ncbi:helix-turn-helix domain-containing protein [Cohnella sp. CFH 77786]|uniref:helix-turn-helix domain-containing protein n=1 Tax=Cohnella sp. CFH 77786 TaxID=2662265 RepID=UPI001C6111A8|nr:helix-turn-helix domain-containing protein [Cohnella sp. CFH 77786]
MNRNWFRKLLLSYLPVFFVVITLLFVIFFQTLNEQNRKEAIKTNDFLAQQVVRYTDNSLKSIDYFVLRQILTSPVVTRFYSDEGVDVFENIQVGKLIDDLKFNYPLVDSVYFVRQTDNYVFADGSVWLDGFPDQPFLDRLKQNKGGVKWTGKRLYKPYPSIAGTEVISLVRGVPYFTTQKKGYIVVNVSLEKLTKSIDQMYNPGISFVRMTDGEGRNLLGGEASPSDHRKVFAQYVSPYTGWQVESGLIDKGFLRIALSSYKVWFVFAFFAVVLGVLWVVQVTRRNYKPIEQLVSLIRTSSLLHPETGKTSGNEFGFIRSALEHMMEETKKIRQENVENSILQRKHRFLEAMEGEVPVPEAEWTSDLNKYNPVAVGRSAYVQVLEIDGYHTFTGSYDQHDLSLFKFLLSSILRETAQLREASVWAEWTTDRRLAAIVWVPDKESLEDIRGQVTDMVIQWVKENLKFTVTLGCGGSASTLEELRRSYEIACSLLAYKAVLGTGRVIRPEEAARPQARSHDYFHSIYSFSHSFRIPDQDWRRHLDELFKQIRDSVFSRKEVESLLLFLHQHLDRVFLDLTREYRNVWKETEAEMSELEQHWETVDELHDGCIRIFNAASEKMQSLRDSHRNRVIIGEIRSYIEEHYSNPELSLEHLSDKFLIHSKNISKLFKEEFGENFVDFLIGLRIRTAKKRLLETEKSLQEISGEVGYYNYNSFNRAFKNIVGVSPSDYRKQASF